MADEPVREEDERARAASLGVELRTYQALAWTGPKLTLLWTFTPQRGYLVTGYATAVDVFGDDAGYLFGDFGPQFRRIVVVGDSVIAYDEY